METILFIILVLVAGYLTTHFVLNKLKTRYLVAGGLEYVLLGVMAGPAGAAIFTWLLGKEDEPVALIEPDVVSSLAPAITLGIGAIGLLTGLRLDLRRTDVRYEFSQLRSTITTSAMTAVLVGIPSLGILLFHTLGAAPPDPNVGWIGLLTGEFRANIERVADSVWDLTPAMLLLIATATVSAVSPVQQAVDRYRAKGWMSAFAVNSAEISEVIAILVFGFVFCIDHRTIGPGFMNLSIDGTLSWMVMQLGIGVTIGLLFSLFFSREDEADKMLVAIIGIVVFSTGVAFYLKLSPTFINFIVGVTLANTSTHRHRIRRRLEEVEKPFYIVLYFFAGVAWLPPATYWVFWLVPGYFLLRAAGKIVGSNLAMRAKDVRDKAVRGIGVGLLAQGGLSVAMVLDYMLVFQLKPGVGTEIYASVTGATSVLQEGVAYGAHHVPALVSTTVLASALASEFLAFRATRNLLINAGEIDPKLEVTFEDDVPRKDPDADLESH